MVSHSFRRLPRYLALSLAPSFAFLAHAQEEAPAPAPAPEEQMEAPAPAEQMPAPAPAAAKPVPPETVVVTVNGQEITEGEIQGRMRQAMQRFGGQMPPQQMQMLMPQMRQMATSQAIDEILLAGAAKKSGIEVDEAKVEEMVTRATQSLPEGLKLEDALKQMDLDVDTWKEEIRSQMQIEELVNKTIASAPEATGEDVQKFYNDNPQYFEKPASVQASHILLSFEDGETDESKAEKKAKLEGFLKEIEGGAEFADLAKEHSSCPSSAKGGDLGSFGKGQMVPPFEKAAFMMEPGQISEVVETNFGYHIIKLTAKTDAGKQPIEEAREQITQHLNQQKKEGVWTAYVEGLRKDAEIVNAE